MKHFWLQPCRCLFWEKLLQRGQLYSHWYGLYGDFDWLIWLLNKFETLNFTCILTSTCSCLLVIVLLIGQLVDNFRPYNLYENWFGIIEKCYLNTFNELYIWYSIHLNMLQYILACFYHLESDNIVLGKNYYEGDNLVLTIRVILSDCCDFNMCHTWIRFVVFDCAWGQLTIKCIFTYPIAQNENILKLF